MSQRKRTQLPPIGPDIDLDAEEVYLADGTRLTEAKATEMAEEAIQHHYRLRGRPSVTGGSEHTPKLTLRVPMQTRDALEEIATRQGRRLADVGRDAFDEYIRHHAAG